MEEVSTAAFYWQPFISQFLEILSYTFQTNNLSHGHEIHLSRVAFYIWKGKYKLRMKTCKVLNSICIIL